MPSLNAPKPKKRLFQKSAVQGAVVGAVLTAAFGVAQLIYLRNSPTPERHTLPARAASLPVTKLEVPPSSPSVQERGLMVPAVAGPKASESTEQPERTRKAIPVPLVEFDRPFQLSELKPLTFRSLSATVSVEFRETLGTQYAELTISTPDQAPKRCAVRNAGARCEFQTGETAAALDVLSVDRANRTASIILRNNSPH
jgi:hypothetical protein